MRVDNTQTDGKVTQRQKIYSLEEFIFNVATIFLNPTELYYFKIFVLANRAFIDTDERNLEYNNVFNHANIEDYIKYGIATRQEMIRLDDAAKAMQATETDKFVVNEHILSLFNQGFIVRYAKYESVHIQYKTPLTFKANNFVDNFNKQLARLYNGIREENDVKRRQQESLFQCKSTSCTQARLTEEDENYILGQLRSKQLRDINCPRCNNLGWLVKNKKATLIDHTAVQSEEILKELLEQADSLYEMMTKNDEDYLERELRAMRAVFNEKIQLKRRVVATEQTSYDRRHIFSLKQQSLQEQEESKKLRLESAADGVDVTSVFRGQGPVFKAPRLYQNGLVDTEKTQWLEAVYERAEQVLRKE